MKLLACEVWTYYKSTVLAPQPLCRLLSEGRYFVPFLRHKYINWPWNLTVLESYNSKFQRLKIVGKIKITKIENRFPPCPLYPCGREQSSMLSVQKLIMVISYSELQSDPSKTLRKKMEFLSSLGPLFQLPAFCRNSLVTTHVLSAIVSSHPPEASFIWRCSPTSEEQQPATGQGEKVIFFPALSG